MGAVEQLKSISRLLGLGRAPKPSLAEQQARIDGFEKDPFFQNVCFNYDSTFTASKRLNQAIADLQAGKRKSVPYSREYWPIEEWIEFDFDMLLKERRITQSRGFNRRINAEESAFWKN